MVISLGHGIWWKWNDVREVAWWCRRWRSGHWVWWMIDAAESAVMDCECLILFSVVMQADDVWCFILRVFCGLDSTGLDPEDLPDTVWKRRRAIASLPSPYPHALWEKRRPQVFVHCMSVSWRLRDSEEGKRIGGVTGHREWSVGGYKVCRGHCRGLCVDTNWGSMQVVTLDGLACRGQVPTSWVRNIRK